MSQDVTQPSLSRRAIALRAAAIAVPLALLLGTVVMLTYHSESRLVRESIVSDEQALLRLRAETLIGHVRDVLRDVRFLASGPAVRAITVGPGESRDEGLRVLQRVFLSLMDAKPYDQVRYIDAEGMEVLRVDRSGGLPALVPSDGLQNKSGRYYFKAAMQLGRAAIYVSPLDLNMEHGRVEEPHKPVLRFAAPVYDASGKKHGALVINALMREALERTARHKGVEGSQIMLVNSLGYWLQSPYPDDEWGFQIMSRASRTFGNDHPRAWRAMREASETVAVTDEGLFLSHDVHLRKAAGASPGEWDVVQGAPLGEKTYFLRFISFVPEEVMVRRLSVLKASSLGLFLAGSLAAAALSVLLAMAVERARAARQAATRRSGLLESALRDLEMAFAAWRKAEQRAKALSRRLESVMDAASEVSIISTDTEGTITVFNSGAVKMLGYTQQEIINKATPAIFHKEEEVQARGVELSWELDRRVEGFEVFVTLPRERGPEKRQWTYVRKDGSERLVDLVVTAVRDESGEITGYLGVAVDVTDQRAAERQLELRNLLLSAMSEASPDGILVVGADNHSLYVNKRFLDIWGLPPDAFEGRPCTDALSSVGPLLPDPEEFMARVAHLYANPRETDHCEVPLTDGQTLERHTVGLMRADGTYLGRLWNYRDITDRKQAERALRRSEERLRLFVRHTPAAVAMFDTDMRYVMASRRWNEDYGLGDTEIIGRSHYEIFPEVPRHWKDIHSRCLTGVTMHHDGDRFERADGSVDFVRWEIVPWHEPDGSVGGIVMFTEVITEKLRAQQAVRDSEARLNAILESAADGIVTIGEDGLIQSVNPAAARIFGHGPADMLGRNVNMIQTEPIRSEHNGYLKRYLETGEARIINQVGREVEGMRADGSIVPLELAVSEVVLEGGPNRLPERLFTGILRDITERKEAEAAILAAKALLEDRQRRIDRDLQAAAAIQRNLLPSASPVTGALEIDWTFRPSQHIGGDIFNLFALDEHHLAVYILDVSGHGVPSALVTVSVSQVLNPSELLTRVNWQGRRAIRAPGEVMNDLSRDFPMERFDMFFTMSYLVIDTRSGEIEYCNAGHPPPLLARASGEVEPLTEGGHLIGLGELASPYPTGTARLEAGDTLLLYTDGLTEYENPSGVQFEQHRLEAALVRNRNQHVDKVLEGIMGDMTAFGQGNEPDDDISVVCIRFAQATGAADARDIDPKETDPKETDQ